MPEKPGKLDAETAARLSPTQRLFWLDAGWDRSADAKAGG